MPAGYVRALFDQYAKHFDLSLLEGLDYRGPQLLFDAVMAACAALGRAPYFDRALDLGCGTGLAGAVFAPRVDSLVGVDLSPAMIEQARRTGCYDHLHVADVLEFLRARGRALRRPRHRGRRRCRIAPISRRSRARSRACSMHGGLFAFTVETHDGDGVLLRETLRYAHGEDHVRAALAAAGLAVVSLDGRLDAPGEERPGSGAGRGGGETGLDRCRLRSTTSGRVTVLERTRNHDAARAVRALVRAARLDAARASARTAGEGARRPLGAADRADRRRQDAGGISAELVELSGASQYRVEHVDARKLGLFPSPRERLERRGGVRGGGRSV